MQGDPCNKLVIRGNPFSFQFCFGAHCVCFGRENRGAGSAGILEAFVVGFEVGGRVGRQMMPSHYKYFHPTSTFGSLALAAAASKLLRLDQEQTEYALGLTADQAAGLRYCVDKGD